MIIKFIYKIRFLTLLILVIISSHLFGQNKSLTGYYAGGCIDSYCTIFRFDNDSVYHYSFPLLNPL